MLEFSSNSLHYYTVNNSLYSFFDTATGVYRIMGVDITGFYTSACFFVIKGDAFKFVMFYVFTFYLFSISFLMSSNAILLTSKPSKAQILSSCSKSSSLPHFLQQYPPNSSLVTSASKESKSALNFFL